MRTSKFLKELHNCWFLLARFNNLPDKNHAIYKRKEKFTSRNLICHRLWKFYNMESKSSNLL